MSDSTTHLRLHHIGIVVGSIEQSIDGYARSLAASWDGRIFADPLQKVKVTFLRLPCGPVQIELVAPNADDAPVLKFLRDRGGGMHHLCYEVPDLAREIAAFRARGAVLAKQPKPAVAFDGRRIAWVLSSERLLIELLEEGPAA